MGKILSKLFGNKEMRILMTGLTGAGKTTVINKLKLGQMVTTVPTAGFSVETVTYKNVKFNIWDIDPSPAQDIIRPLWRHYYTGVDALIFVVDSAARDRIEIARQELHRIINDREMKDAIILIMANKQDKLGALKPHEIQEKLGLTRIRDRNWFVQPTTATTGDGLYEGLTWVTRNTVAVEDSVAEVEDILEKGNCESGKSGTTFYKRKDVILPTTRSVDSTVCDACPSMSGVDPRYTCDAYENCICQPPSYFFQENVQQQFGSMDLLGISNTLNIVLFLTLAMIVCLVGKIFSFKRKRTNQHREYNIVNGEQEQDLEGLETGTYNSMAPRK